MAVFIILLDDTGHQVHIHIMETHPMRGILSMTKALPKNIEAFESRVKYLLAILKNVGDLDELGNRLDVIIVQLGDFINYFVHVGFPNN